MESKQQTLLFCICPPINSGHKSTINSSAITKPAISRQTFNSRLLLLILGMASYIVSPSSLADTPLTLKDSKSKYQFGQHMSVLEDAEGKLTINEVSQQKNRKNFRILNKHAPNLGFTKSVYWVRITLNNNSSQTNWLLDQSFANTHYLDLYTQNDNKGDWTVRKSGNLRPYRNRDLPHRRIIFKLSLAADQQTTLYLRFQSHAAISLNLRLWTETAFFAHDRAESFWIGTYYGLLIAILLINLFLYIAFRKPSYLFLVAFAATIGATYLFYDGYAQQLFNENYIGSSRHFIPMLLSLSMLAFLYYGRVLLLPTTQNTAFQRVHYGLVLSWITLFALEPIADYHVTIRLMIPFALLTPAYLLVVGITCWKQQNLTAQFFVIGLVFSFAGWLSLALARTGVIDSYFFLDEGIRFALVVLLMCMSLAVINHINQLQKSEEQSKKIINVAEARFSAIFNQTFQMLGLLSPKGILLEANQTALALGNLSSAEVIGQHFWETPWFNNNPDLQKRLRSAINKAANGEFMRFEIQLTDTESNIHHIDFSIKPIRDKNGKINMLIPEGRDITNIKNAELQEISSSRKYHMLFETANDAIFLMSSEKFIDCNQKTLEMFQCKREDIINNTPIAFSPEFQPDGETSINKAMKRINIALQGEPQFFVWQHLHLDGSPFDAEVSLNRLEIDNTVYLQAIVRDITERNRTEQAIKDIAIGVSGHAGETFFQHMVLNLGKLFDVEYAFIGLIDKNNPDRINTIALCTNNAISDNISYDLPSSPCKEILSCKSLAYFENVRESHPKDLFLKELSAVGYIASPIFKANDEPVGLIAAVDTKPINKQDRLKPILEIFAARAGSELERINATQHIRQLAYTDYLTGLANRASLHEHLTKVLTHNRLTSGAMLLIDLDHFKTINDALSHDVGDSVLKLVAQRLREIAGEKIYLARIGGDEFAAVISQDPSLHDTAIQESAYTLANKIVSDLSKPLFLDDRILNIGASIGVVLFPEQGDSELDIMRRADMALYRAKNMGRGNVQAFEPSLQKAADERLLLERGLRHALENNELSLKFQPQTSANGKNIGVEALLRWYNPDLGHVSPDRFISIAEETGLIHKIGEWVLNSACEQMRAWDNSRAPFRGHMSINISAWQFGNSEFLRSLTQILNKYSISAKKITLELTETALLLDIQDTINKLKVLRKAGFKIALDDFGTGYSSLAYLKDMEMDILKIDKVFVHELIKETEHPLVETIIAMGQHMNLKVIAEGVETKEQLDILVKLGCTRFQGYYFSHPLTANQFEKWIKTKTKLKKTTNTL